MAIKVEMPKLSDTMEEGVIAKWNVKEGDKVESGDIIAEVETDKATMEVEVFDAGTILKILVEEGDAVPLGNLMAIVGEEGEDVSEMVKSAAKTSSGSEDAENKKKQSKTDDDQEEAEDPVFGDLEQNGAEQKTAKQTTTSSGDGRVKASPLAKKMAEEKGIKLSNIEGSGPEGRIIKKDIESYTPSGQATKAMPTAAKEDTEHRVSQMRKTIAKRLAESKFTNPHYYETVDVDMQPVFSARKQLNETGEIKVSFNDIIVKASATALRRHPAINSSWQGDTILEHGDVNVAVAVAIDDGLLTPVIRQTDEKGLAEISEETKELASLARDRKLQPEQMEGSTFTISNLGMFGIEEFTAIINPPNACILAVGAIRDVPVVQGEEVVPGKRMKMTLSSDHRIVDGATAAKFLSTLKHLLENPLGMLL